MKKRILFLLANAEICGPTNVIFQHAKHLKKMGYEVTIGLVFITMDDFNQILPQYQAWHPAIKELEFKHISEVSDNQYDVAIFTLWSTLFALEYIKASSYLYFVQSIESQNFASQENFLRNLADRTYQLGVPIITKAAFLQNHLQEKYAVNPSLVKAGILKEVYKEEGPRYAEKEEGKLRILVEGPLTALSKKVSKTLEICRKANAGEIWLLTDASIKTYPGVSRIFSQVPIQDVSMIYRACDVVVKLSSAEDIFSPMLEMFHCGGTAIVYDLPEYREYMVHHENALLAKNDDEVVQFLQLLQQDQALLSKLKQGARNTAKQWIDWETSSAQFADAIEEIAKKPVTEPIMDNVMQYLHEHIRVILTSVDGKETHMEYEAIPIWSKPGIYYLSIPLTENEMYVGIVFGQNYKKLNINSARLIEVENPGLDAKLVLDIDEMKQSGFTFDCTSQYGMLVAHYSKINLETTKQHCLRVEFRPIQINQVEEAFELEERQVSNMSPR